MDAEISGWVALVLMAYIFGGLFFLSRRTKILMSKLQDETASEHEAPPERLSTWKRLVWIRKNLADLPPNLKPTAEQIVSFDNSLWIAFGFLVLIYILTVA